MSNRRDQKGKHRSEAEAETETHRLPSQEMMNFRMLCHVDTAGGVIGNNGTEVRHLQNQTGCRILVEKPIRNCLERVINVTGDAAVERDIVLNNGTGEPEAVHVSAAQEGLLRVLERILELEGNGSREDGAVGCRLLGNSFQISALMELEGNGENVDAIRRIHGAKIQVLNNKDHLPACIAEDDELIQIMGGRLSVKRALVSVSQCLQDCATGRIQADMSLGVPLHEDLADLFSQAASLMPAVMDSAVDTFPVGHSVSKYVDRVLTIDKENSQHKIAFKLLCSNNSAAGVIGCGGSVIHALENETGACISFCPPVHGSKDRVAIIFSFEKRYPVYPSAQIAVVRVFEKSMEVALECGLISGLHKGTIVTAKILVTSHQLRCLIDEKGQVCTDIGSTSGVKIKLSPRDLLQDLVAENEEVIQIVGEYFNVKVALFQVTGKLRGNFFPSFVSEGVAYEQYPDSSMPESSHDEVQLNLDPEMDHVSDLSSPEKVDPSRFVPNLGGPHKLLSNKQGFLPQRMNESMDVKEVTNKTVEIEVPEQKMCLVYGLEGSSLTILKESSGAQITVQDPHPGENSGKVIISGTPEQVQVAKCLLQAFIYVKP
nr:KH domain-containing protein HEN4-like [Ipomoea batatas]